MSSKKEIMNIRFHLPVSVHAKVKQVQGLLQSKTGDSVTIAETYAKVMERGAIEILKKNR